MGEMAEHVGSDPGKWISFQTGNGLTAYFDGTAVPDGWTGRTMDEDGKSSIHIVLTRRPTHEELAREAIRRLARTLAWYTSLALMTVVCILSLLHYIHLQGELTMTLGEIASLEQQEENLRCENDNLLRSIRDNTDMDYIRMRAVKGLGMSYPTKGQTVDFDLQKPDQVVQVEQITGR